MVVDLNETLESLLEQIDVAEGPISMELYTCSQQIEDEQHPYGNLDAVDHILFNELND